MAWPKRYHGSHSSGWTSINNDLCAYWSRSSLLTTQLRIEHWWRHTSLPDWTVESIEGCAWGRLLALHLKTCDCAWQCFSSSHWSHLQVLWEEWDSSCDSSPVHSRDEPHREVLQTSQEADVASQSIRTVSNRSHSIGSFTKSQSSFCETLSILHCMAWSDTNSTRYSEWIMMSLCSSLEM